MMVQATQKAVGAVVPKQTLPAAQAGRWMGRAVLYVGGVTLATDKVVAQSPQASAGNSHDAMGAEEIVPMIGFAIFLILCVGCCLRDVCGPSRSSGRPLTPEEQMRLAGEFKSYGF